MPVDDPRRLVPRTDLLLGDARLVAAVERLGSAEVKRTIINVQQLIRSGAVPPDAAVDAVIERLPALATTLTRVLNATGVVLHTNLGRARLSPAAIEAIEAAAGYLDVEFDLATGQRAKRGRGALDALRQAVPDAEDVLAVNNGAAALVLATTALATGREVVVSRGELVEIGDGFRLPDLIESTGARIREVGTTNRTTVGDYAAAITENTGCILKVHPSNFRIEGFTRSVESPALAELDALVVVDVGSGLLRPDPLLPDEPDVTTALLAGADLVTCSGDKLLGGPQAGLIFGRADIVNRLRRHSLARALRVDKLTLAALEATLRGPATPTHRYLHADAAGLRVRTDRIASALSAQVIPSAGAVGGGGAPGLELPGWAIALPERHAEPLRSADPPVIGRIEHGQCLLDVRCIDEADDETLIAAVRQVLGAPAQS